MVRGKIGGALLVGLLLACVVGSARRTGLGHFGGRNSLTDNVKPAEVQEAEINPRFSGERFQFSEYEQRFSSLGNRQTSLREIEPDLADADPRMTERFRRGERRVQWSTEPETMEEFEVRDWNRLRENLLSHEFSETELRTPEARQLQQRVDQLSVQQLNRFTSQRNKLSEGIPQVAAGEEQPVSFLGNGGGAAESGSGRSSGSGNRSWSNESSPWFRNGESRVEASQRGDGVTQRITTSVRMLPPEGE